LLGGGVFICVKNYIDCRELWSDEDFEMLAVEVKGRNPKFTWDLQSTKRGHASYRKISSPNWVYRQLYKA
jgi:hypothetical protein